MRQTTKDPLGPRAAKKLKNDGLLTTSYAGVTLRYELDRIPLWRGNHVAIRQFVEDFATYLYLPRLRDEEVLFNAIRDGLSILTWETDTFGYAFAWDETSGRYKGLNPSVGRWVFEDPQRVLVKPDIAARQISEERAAQTLAAGQQAIGVSTGSTQIPTPGARTPQEPVFRRFHGVVNLDPVRISRDVDTIAKEVVHLFGSLTEAEVKIVLEISFKSSKGFPEKTRRDVTENCRTLKFNAFGFEEE